jgi:hypothetical protein
MGGGNAIETSYDLHTIRYYGDVTLGYPFGAEHAGIRTGWIPTAECLGIPANEADRPYPVPFVVHRPDHVAYVGREDYSNYYVPGSSFFLGNTQGSDFLREHQVEHFTYRGDIQDSELDSIMLFRTEPHLVDVVYGPGGVPIQGYRGRNSSPEYPIQYWGRYGRRIGTNAKGNGIFDTPPISPYFFNPPTFDLVEHVKGLKLLFTVGSGLLTYPVFGPYTAVVTNFVDNGTTSGALFTYVDCEYDYAFIWNNTYTVLYHVHKRIYVRVVPYFGTNYPTDSNLPDTGPFQIEDSSTVELVHQDIPGGGPDVGSIPRMSIVSSSINGGLIQYEADSVPNFVSYRFADKRYLDRRSDIARGIFHDLLGDIRPSSFLSSADALNKHLLALGTNHIQTLQKLGQILELLPELTKLPFMLEKLSRGDLSVLKDLIDYVTGEILRYRFAQAPLKRAIDEIVGSNVPAFLKSLGKTDTYIIYGNFEYEIPHAQNPYNDGVLKLVTRSKISISQDLSTMMESILMANSVGLLPTFSRIWEIIPFSFVIDWFTGMNKRLKLFDTQLAYMAFRTNWCLHSYRLSYYPSSEALSDFGLENVDDAKPFSLSVYRREKSAYMPRLRDSRFDFLATSGPNPLTAGALAWQLFT